MMTPQQRAAKTRALNAAGKRFYEEVSKPAHDKIEKILNDLLLGEDIRLKWVGNWRLKNGVTEGRLVKIGFGGLDFTVHVDGYKDVKVYSSSYWEVI